MNRKLIGLMGDPWVPVFANSLDAFVPEVWAQESLMVLYEQMVMAPLIHRDFSPEVAQQGDIVNTRQPAKFAMKRKIDSDSVTTQDATATNVQVPLDQHGHVSFVIKDGEESKSMFELRRLYLEPALKAVARGVDETILGERYNFLGNVAGTLGDTITKPSIVAAGQVMDENLVGEEHDRWMIHSPGTKADLLNVGELTKVDEAGDAGRALRKSILGEIHGFNHVATNNLKTVGAANAGQIINASDPMLADGAHAKGATTIAVDTTGVVTAPEAGQWITFAGDDIPQLILTVTGGTSPTEVTIHPGLGSAIVDNAISTNYIHAETTTTYASGWVKPLAIDGVTLAPSEGRMISTGITSARIVYGAMSGSTGATDLSVNRAIEGALTDNHTLGLGPDGEYSFGFVKNAVALVSRPLAQPASGLTLSAVAEEGGVGIRVVITYDGEAQGHRVTVDLLYGVKTLDTDLGCLLLGAG